MDDQQPATAEQLSLVIRLYDFEGQKPLSANESGALLNLVAESTKNTFEEQLAEAFGLTRYDGLSLVNRVTIYALPFPHAKPDARQVVKSLITFFGYMVVVSGAGLLGAEAYFVKRNALALGKAAEAFSPLGLIG